MDFKQAGKVYMGLDRRSNHDRRGGHERRNLVRFESLGADRRVQSYRRKEDVFLVGHGY